MGTVSIYNNVMSTVTITMNATLMKANDSGLGTRSYRIANG